MTAKFSPLPVPRSLAAACNNMKVNEQIERFYKKLIFQLSEKVQHSKCYTLLLAGGR